MSRYITSNEKDTNTFIEEIESIDICKWRINDMCCNENSDYLADYPYPTCKCESKDDCNYFEEEDGVIEGE